MQSQMLHLGLLWNVYLFFVEIFHWGFEISNGKRVSIVVNVEVIYKDHE